MSTAKPTSVDEYIRSFSPEIKQKLKRIRSVIKKTAPKAEESISYGIAAFKLNGKALIYFAGFANHVSVYPAPRSAPEFKKDLAEYKGGKGTVQFPLDKSLPVHLLIRIVKFRIKLASK